MFKGKNHINRYSAIKLILVSTLFVFLLVFIDLYTKSLAVSALTDKDRIVIIDGVLELFYLENTGAAFSFLVGHTWVFLITTPVIILAVLWFYFRIPSIKRMLPIRIIVLFVISGAIGNYIDRLKLGYVRDFIYFSLIDFPVFNVADIYVTCSVFIFIILFIFYYKDEDMDNIFSFKNSKS